MALGVGVSLTNSNLTFGQFGFCLRSLVPVDSNCQRPGLTTWITLTPNFAAAAAW